MPSRIAGSRLTVGAAIRLVDPQNHDGKVIHKVDRAECDRRFFFDLYTSEASLPPPGQLFAVRFYEVSNPTVEDEYVIQASPLAVKWRRGGTAKSTKQCKYIDRATCRHNIETRSHRSRRVSPGSINPTKKTEMSASMMLH